MSGVLILSKPILHSDVILTLGRLRQDGESEPAWVKVSSKSEWIIQQDSILKIKKIK